MAFEIASKLLPIDVAFSYINKCGSHFLQYIQKKAFSANRVHRNKGNDYELYTCVPMGNEIEFRAKPHRLWLGGSESILDREIHFSLAVKLTTHGTVTHKKDYLYFQSTRMQEEGRAFLIIGDINGPNNSRITYVNVDKPVNDHRSIIHPVKVHELNSLELDECMCLMKKIEEDNGVCIDPPQCYGENIADFNVIQLSENALTVFESDNAITAYNEVLF